MKTAPIQQKIILEFNRLKQIPREPFVEPENYPTWGLNYRKNATKGFVAETGYITRNSAQIQIDNNGNVNLIKKPFFASWKRTLKNISNMLEDITTNYNDKDIVKKRVVRILCFSKKDSERLAKIASNIRK